MQKLGWFRGNALLQTTDYQLPTTSYPTIDQLTGRRAGPATPTLTRRWPLLGLEHNGEANGQGTHGERKQSHGGGC